MSHSDKANLTQSLNIICKNKIKEIFFYEHSFVITITPKGYCFFIDFTKYHTLRSCIFTMQVLLFFYPHARVSK